MTGLPNRVATRVHRAAQQPPSLRRAFVLAPLERRLPLPAAAVRLRRLTRVPVLQLARFYREAGRSGIGLHLRDCSAEYMRAADSRFYPGTIDPAEGSFLYALVRALKPQFVVETGVANGSSSSYLLAALERNGRGRLLSIDLPFHDTAGEITPVLQGTTIELVDSSPIPSGREPGWMVPERLRGRWELRLGDARDLLPAAVEEAELDLFFHDSLHTREHMLFEFRTAWPRLRTGGVLASDDVFLRKHDALPAFAESVGCRFTTFGALGFARKP